jgi:hypothetical protein
MHSNEIGGRVPATGYALASGMGENSGMGLWIAANEQVVALGRREAVGMRRFEHYSSQR